MLLSMSYTDVVNVPTGGLVGRFAAGVGALQPISLGSGLSLSADGVLSASGSGVTSVNGRSGAVTLTSTDVGLGNVENTALSTWAGSGNITTVGTLASGSIPTSLITGLGTLAALNAAPAGTLTGTSLNTSVVTSSLTSLGAQAAALNMNSHQINTVSDPSSAQDAATKKYVDLAIQGLDVKTSCIAATTANITLSGTQTIDGIAVVVGNRVLVKNQSTPSQNGLYVVAAGAWARSSDGVQGELTSGAFTFIESGTVNGTTGWTLTTADPITVGTTSLTFTQFSGAGTYSAGAGLTLTGTQFSIGSGAITNSMLTGIITSSLGGTGNGFTKFSGPTTSEKTFTLPDASATILTSNAVVTVAQGGIGVGTLASNGVLYGNGTSAVQALAVNATATNKFLTQVSSGAPAWNTIAATDLPGSFNGFANPSASVGLAAVNGSNATAMRSDGAPALSQAIAPTWTGLHVFAVTARSSGSAQYHRIQTPADTAITLSTEAIGIQFGGDGSAATVSRQWSTGALTLQRENLFVGETYTAVAASTFSVVSTVDIQKPLQGTNVTLTYPFSLTMNGAIGATPVSGSNQAGTNFTIIAGLGTGTGVGGSLIGQVSPAGSTGSALNAPLNVLSMTATGVYTYGDTTQVLTSQTHTFLGTNNAGSAMVTFKNSAGTSNAMIMSGGAYQYQLTAGKPVILINATGTNFLTISGTGNPSTGTLGYSASASTTPTAAFSWDENKAIQFAGKVIQYNGITAVGLGIPAVYATANITAQSAAATITSYTAPASDGDYEISATLNVTAASSISTSIGLTYTDVNNVAQTTVVPLQKSGGTAGTFLANGLAITTGDFSTPVMRIRVKASTTITIKTNTGTFTSVTYSASGTIKQTA